MTLRLPEPISREQAVLRTTLLDGPRRGRASATSTPATRAIALFEIARVYLPATASCPTSRRVAGIVEGGFCRAKGVARGAVRRAAASSSTFERDAGAVPAPGQGGADGRGLARRAAPGRARGRVGRRSSSTSRRSSPRSPEPVAYEDVITFPPVRAGPRRSSSPEDVPAGDARRGRARGRRAGAARGARLRRLPRRAGRRRDGSRSRSRSCSSRPSGRSRTRTRPRLRGADRRRARRALRRRAARLNFRAADPG